MAARPVDLRISSRGRDFLPKHPEVGIFSVSVSVRLIYEFPKALGAENVSQIQETSRDLLGRVFQEHFVPVSFVLFAR